MDDLKIIYGQVRVSRQRYYFHLHIIQWLRVL